MKGKRNILIFTNDNLVSFSRAIKETLAEDKTVLPIVISEDEFLHSGLQILKEKLFDPRSAALSLLSKLKMKREDKNLDKQRSNKTDYKAGVLSYEKMHNVFIRYNPDLLIFMTGTVFKEALAVRDRFSPNTKIVFLQKDFAVNMRSVYAKVDKYVCLNTAMLTALANVGIKEKDIAIADIPVCKEFKEAKDKDALIVKYGLSADYPTAVAVFCPFYAAEDTKVIDALARFANKCNVLIAADTNRKLYEYASSKSLKTFNEAADIGELYALADIAFTRPIAKNVIEAFATDTPVALTAPVGEAETRSIQGINCGFIDATTDELLTETLTMLGERDKKLEDLISIASKAKSDNLSRAAAQSFSACISGLLKPISY